MPANRIQHYVPKCHLRPFCSGSEAVNLYNIRRDKLIEGAPIKGQCARTYFYGKDGKLERALQPIEGFYATTVAKLTNDHRSATPADLANLRDFTLLQTFRTYGYIEKLLAVSDSHYADLEVAHARHRRGSHRHVDTTLPGLQEARSRPRDLTDRQSNAPAIHYVG